MTWHDDGVLINDVFDFIMDTVRSHGELVERYRVVPVPALVEKVQAPGLGATATLRASRGTLTDLTSLRRAGDITLTTNGNCVFVKGSVSLGTLGITFRHYSLHAGMLAKSGDKLDIQVTIHTVHSIDWRC